MTDVFIFNTPQTEIPPKVARMATRVKERREAIGSRRGYCGVEPSRRTTRYRSSQRFSKKTQCFFRSRDDCSAFFLARVVHWVPFNCERACGFSAHVAENTPMSICPPQGSKGHVDPRVVSKTQDFVVLTGDPCLAVVRSTTPAKSATCSHDFALSRTIAGHFLSRLMFSFVCTQGLHSVKCLQDVNRRSTGCCYLQVNLCSCKSQVLTFRGIYSFDCSHVFSYVVRSENRRWA